MRELRVKMIKQHFQGYLAGDVELKFELKEIPESSLFPSWQCCLPAFLRELSTAECGCYP